MRIIYGCLIIHYEIWTVSDMVFRVALEGHYQLTVTEHPSRRRLLLSFPEQDHESWVECFRTFPGVLAVQSGHEAGQLGYPARAA